ncbi:hypothetical protein [Nostoc sp.]|uniref:hypothetical protein n=1 Tax=Nostoc sp. TaxID=1180 RepID=UPI002FF81B9A
MQRLFQKGKRLISMCLVTLLIVTSALTISPAPARADIVFVKCEQGSNCGNLAAFAAGVASGSAVTLITTGHAATLAAAGATVSSAAAVASGTIAAAGAAVGSAVVAPVLVPVAATAAIGYVGYHAWKAHNHSEPDSST